MSRTLTGSRKIFNARRTPKRRFHHGWLQAVDAPSWAAACTGRWGSLSRRAQARPRECLELADIVAKVENRTTLKISRKLIFGLLCCCVALQRHHGGP